MSENENEVADSNVDAIKAKIKKFENSQKAKNFIPQQIFSFV